MPPPQVEVGDDGEDDDDDDDDGDDNDDDEDGDGGDNQRETSARTEQAGWRGHNARTRDPEVW